MTIPEDSPVLRRIPRLAHCPVLASGNSDLSDGGLQIFGWHGPRPLLAWVLPSPRPLLAQLLYLQRGADRTGASGEWGDDQCS